MLNKVILLGRLTADPELRQTPNNISTINFTIAVDRPYQKDKEKQADFISCVAWRQTAEFISKYFARGRMIIVEGALRTRTYDDKHGARHYITEVQVENVQFGETKGTSSGSTSTGNSSGSSPATEPSVPPPDEEASAAISIGDLGGFEEILVASGQLPF